MLMKLLWAVYLALLAVLLPHTAWAFSQFEPINVGMFGIKWGSVVAWTAAFAFEAAIAALTHRLSQHISSSTRYKNVFKRAFTRYVNAYSISLVIAMSVSALANSAHAREFGRPMAILEGNASLQLVYEVAFSTVLPLVSLLFASVLSSSADIEAGTDEEKEELKKKLSRTRREDARILNTFKEESSATIERLTGEIGELKGRLALAGAMQGLVSTEKKEVIETARGLWPDLPQSSLAKIANASSAYVSKLVGGNGDV